MDTYKSFEVSEATLSNQSDCLRICLIYRPGTNCKSKRNLEQSNLSLFFRAFDSYLDDISHKTGKPLTSGDFNFHLENDFDNNAKHFRSFLSGRVTFSR